MGVHQSSDRIYISKEQIDLSSRIESPNRAHDCKDKFEAYVHCLTINKGDQTKCNEILDKINECVN